MKELSIEEKAKRYDESIKRAKDFMNGEVHYELKIGESIMCWVFPELRESEDEKIRKALMQNLKERFGTKGNMGEGLDMPDVLAWLEKQGEQKQQGKSALEVIKEEEVDNRNYVKSIDNIEPKFKVGDWINGYYTNYKVLLVDNKGYTVEDVDGNKINILFENEKFHHLWTIQDAKDGDILYSQKGAGVECIHLIRGWEKIPLTGNTLCSMCTYRMEDNKIIAGGIGAVCWDGVKDKFTPATKEQRDLLFQKMKEAGYEWGAEKKELKKIGKIPANSAKTCKDEQTPAWSEEDSMVIKILRTMMAAYAKDDEERKKLVRLLDIHCNAYPIPSKLLQAWKPSDEQMVALDDFIYAKYPNIEKYRAAVKSLYQDLKKLREE